MRTSFHTRTATEDRLVVYCAAENKCCMDLFPIRHNLQAAPSARIDVRAPLRINRACLQLLDEQIPRALLRRSQRVIGCCAGTRAQVTGDQP